MGRKASSIARMENSVVPNGLIYRWPVGSNPLGLLLLTLEPVSNFFITLVPQVAGQYHYAFYFSWLF